MNAMLHMQNLLASRTSTENGAAAYVSTLNHNLDFFAESAACRYIPQNAIELFEKAMQEDYQLAVANLLYLRDIRHGCGERSLFRRCFQYLALKYPCDAAYLLPYIAQIGRFDDLFTVLHTPVEPALIQLIQNQLNKDLENQKHGCVSLLPKWMPSINTSSYQTRMRACHLAKELGMTPAQYRRLLSKLRKGQIVETNLTQRDYTFDYDKLPAGALHKYRIAFQRNDEARYEQYLEDVQTQRTAMKTQTLYPHQIVGKYDIEYYQKDLELKWQTMCNTLPVDDSNTIVVRDGSGSMTWNNNIPYSIATALSLLFASRLRGPFAHSFITFSRIPKLVKLPADASLQEQLQICEEHFDASNTNLEAVYDLIYETSLQIEDPKDYIQRIVIISDMEFDEGCDHIPPFERIKRRFKAANIPLPQIIFWNVCARNIHFSAQSHENVRFICGASQNSIQAVLEDDTFSPEAFMLKQLQPYQAIVSQLAKR